MFVINLARAQTRPKARTHLSRVFTKRLIVPQVGSSNEGCTTLVRYPLKRLMGFTASGDAGMMPSRCRASTRCSLVGKMLAHNADGIEVCTRRSDHLGDCLASRPISACPITPYSLSSKSLKGGNAVSTCAPLFRARLRTTATDNAEGLHRSPCTCPCRHSVRDRKHDVRHTSDSVASERT